LPPPAPSPKQYFVSNDFMDPSVLFIFGSLVIGMTFTKVGLTKRLAYKMLTIYTMVLT